ncbi:hypothetical protein HP550_17545 [Cellulomonas humilata]|uniref:Uncharacterized protein n=1 Tax=Cellulomonas humilata TaxID=144055 RepID=A0A7Y6DY01_9CELL|nr:hypothetical protein [Cellulomonas humilata]NUU19056.1 hypothetical protein [Cellulomonas humilata]
MTESVGRLRPVDEPLGDDVEVVDLVDYCARPQCRKEFRHSGGRGRRREYCSETCRRLADRDYKRAKAMVEHFERLAQRSRHDVRAFGRGDDEPLGGDDVPVEVQRERASAAIARARAILQFAENSDPRLVAELSTLCDSLDPVVARLG